MERDYTLFPEDENGNTLWMMQQDGDHLDEVREIDFSVIFPSDDQALQFALRLLRHGQRVSFGPCENEEFPWQVEVHPNMEPSHENISEFERLLAEDAEPLEGRNDGWGCFSVE